MKKFLGPLNKKLELTAIAITYAEHGEWKIAEDYLNRIKELNRDKTPKMLLITLDSDVCPKAAEYSVNLAERMKYNLLALRIIPSSSKKRVFRSLENTARKASVQRTFDIIKEKAKGRKIRLETLIAVCDLRAQIRKLVKQFQSVELVFIQDTQGHKITLDLNVPVYQIETGEVC